MSQIIPENGKNKISRTTAIWALIAAVIAGFMGSLNASAWEFLLVLILLECVVWLATYLGAKKRLSAGK